MRGLFFIVYPPDDEFNYYHYKCGLRAWGDCNPVSKFALLLSIISLIISILKKF